METATEKDTRLFRFGAVVPEEHQDLALRLAALEDRLNGEVTIEATEDGIKYVYFIPTITVIEDLPEEQSIIKEEEYLFIRVNCPPVFEFILDKLLAALHRSAYFSEGFLVELTLVLRGGE